jgi:vancomycin resistance protein YoaR
VKHIEISVIALAAAAVVIAVSLFAAPLVFADRLSPGTKLGTLALNGVTKDALPGILTSYEESLQRMPTEVTFRGQKTNVTLGELGLTLNKPQTIEAIEQASQGYIWPHFVTIKPIINLNETVAREILHQRFGQTLKLPKNATLQFNNAGQLALVAGTSGEQIDVITLEQDIRSHIAENELPTITLQSIMAAPPVQDTEVESARALATQLLSQGFKVTFEDKTFEMKPFTIRRLLTFREQADPKNDNNQILGLVLNPIELGNYLTSTLAPEINSQPVNARFELKDDKVEQFAVPQAGQALNIEESVQAINTALASGQAQTQLAVDITDPDVTANADIAKLGIDELIAHGETDFKGSPKNRIHNITVGASRYHGILIPPNAEFSFLEFLGPVDGDHGFKPELVIKTNVTVPEFGGGLCQVSTTAFRAAIEAGLKITQRRNHSYAVRYYGTPGFDATIYPPYTDLRFLNNTPAYILVQTKIEGTKLTFDFYGTKDGRTVTVDGPHPYNRQPNGAIKATLKQTVVSPEGQPFIEDTFYSNYKSPDLFPHVVAANGEAPPGQVAGSQTNVTNPTPTPNPQSQN